MWREIKELVTRRKRTVIRWAIFDNTDYKENIQLANQFNRYFVDSIRDIKKFIGDVQYNQETIYRVFVQIKGDNAIRT